MWNFIGHLQVKEVSIIKKDKAKEEKRRIKVITDSTTSLNKKECEEYGIDCLETTYMLDGELHYVYHLAYKIVKTTQEIEADIFINAFGGLTPYSYIGYDFPETGSIEVPNSADNGATYSTINFTKNYYGFSSNLMGF
mgnify:CR=1 FL=1